MNPLKSATSFSLQSTRVIRRVIIALVVFACITYSYSLFLYDSAPKRSHEFEESQKEVCGPASEYKKVISILEVTLDSFLTMIVPAVGILFMNFSICRSLSKYNKENIFYSTVSVQPDNISEFSIYHITLNENGVYKHFLARIWKWSRINGALIFFYYLILLMV